MPYSDRYSDDSPGMDDACDAAYARWDAARIRADGGALASAAADLPVLLAGARERLERAKRAIIGDVATEACEIALACLAEAEAALRDCDGAIDEEANEAERGA